MNATTNADLLGRVRIATPCQARWDDMQGDERVRFCLHCSKNVYDFSAMTSADAAALIREKEGNLCGRFYQRADGTMLTADCPVGVARHWRRVKAFAGAAVATLVMTFTSFAMVRSNESEADEAPGRLAKFREEAVDRVKGWLGIRRPRPTIGVMCVPAPTPAKPTIGEVCVTPTATNTPPLQGKIAIPAPTSQK